MASKEQAQSAVAEKTEPRVSEKDADVTYNLLKSHGEDVVLSLDVTAENWIESFTSCWYLSCYSSTFCSS
jgi:hypothetical protein